MTDDDDLPPPSPTEGVTPERIRTWLELRPAPLTGIHETEHERTFDGSPRFDKRWPHYRAGFGRDLDERARFLKRWFDFPDLGKRGWAIIFQNYPPPGPSCELFLGWVPHEREAEADGWISFMNAETARLLRESAAEKAKSADRGAVSTERKP